MLTLLAAVADTLSIPNAFVANQKRIARQRHFQTSANYLLPSVRQWKDRVLLSRFTESAALPSYKAYVQEGGCSRLLIATKAFGQVDGYNDDDLGTTLDERKVTPSFEESEFFQQVPASALPNEISPSDLIRVEGLEDSRFDEIVAMGGDPYFYAGDEEAAVVEDGVDDDDEPSLGAFSKLMSLAGPSLGASVSAVGSNITYESGIESVTTGTSESEPFVWDGIVDEDAYFDDE
jgi:hypothetical protein